MIGDIIELNKHEQRLVVYMAKCRYESNRKKGAKAEIYNGTDPIKAEKDSYGAEVAYCKMMNVYPDLDTDHYVPYDAILREGEKVDVKDTMYKTGKLLVKMMDRKSLPDKYALMIGEFPTYRFAGHVSASEVLQEKRIDREFPHPAYVVYQSELTE